MAAPGARLALCVLARVRPFSSRLAERAQGIPVWPWSRPQCPLLQLGRPSCSAASRSEKTSGDGVAEQSSRYKDQPWNYLESEEYKERYGSRPVWSDYRRNHKGGIPPQKTRKTCIRGDKISGNPCPVCRDANIIVHYQNVKLLEQFVDPYSGELYDATRTGVCMKQQKQLKQAIASARDHGLLPFQVPLVDFSGEDYSNSHDAVGCTPPCPSMAPEEPWYPWYEAKPDEHEVAKVKKIYKAFLKQ
ncbi:hypothetical protein Z043_110227 [Scleropages formosus]|uniref:Small ribosomal subunit protein mS40 n=1 Tax=Scleropages formosus TaxID=113540 RepID=A0A0N8K019_SCLFO|nr:hypothetical protein Z043_110227 [Scleropages formosus]